MVRPNCLSLFHCLLTALFLPAICTRGLYSLVAHPIMTGFLLGTVRLDLAPSSFCSPVSDAGFWATPIMNGPRLLMAAFNTIYLVSAVKFLEGIPAVCLCVMFSITTCFFTEPRLRKAHGQAYSKYLSVAAANRKLHI
jgi:protein-S-isoprenylcysteine O-methyltransferase Ste14